MRITTQPAVELSTVAAKIPSPPAASATFGATLAVASGSKSSQITHGTADRGDDKKSDRTKTADAADSPSILQTQLASSVMPAVTMPFTLGLPAAAQPTAPQVPADAGDTTPIDNSNRSEQSAAPNALASPSALLGLAAPSISAGVPQQLLTPQAPPISSVEPSQSALTAPPSVLEAVQDSAAPALPDPAQASTSPAQGIPPTSDNPSFSLSASNQADSQSAVTPAAHSLSPAVSTVAPPIDAASTLISPNDLTAATAGNTEPSPAPQVQSAADPASAQTTPIVSPTGSDITQGISTPNSIGKAQTPLLTSKDGNLKQGTVSSKDRSLAADVKGKRKSDDSDIPPSTAAASSTPSDAKPEDASSQSGQGDSSRQTGQHLAGSEAILQQAVQATVPITSPASHPTPQSTTADQGSNASSAPTQPVPAPNTDVAASTAVNSAQLVQSIHQSDMRLGMHSPDFGAISIDTSLTHQALSAQISTDHTELGRALALHLPSIEEKLGNAYGLHAKVEVRDSSTASYGDSSQQQSQSQQARANRQSQSQSGTFVAGTSSMLATMTVLSSSTASAASTDARLDIRI